MTSTVRGSRRSRSSRRICSRSATAALNCASAKLAWTIWPRSLLPAHRRPGSPARCVVATLSRRRRLARDQPGQAGRHRDQQRRRQRQLRQRERELTTPRRDRRLLMPRIRAATPRPQVPRRQLFAPLPDRLRQDVVLRRAARDRFLRIVFVRSCHSGRQGAPQARSALPAAVFLFNSPRSVCRARCSCDFDVPGETPRMSPISSCR